MNESKQSRFEAAIRRHVEDALNEFIADSVANNPAVAQTLRASRSHLAISVGDRATRPYALRELLDIAQWKKPRP